MAHIVCYLLAFALFNYAEAQQLQSNISLGSALTPTTNSSWVSRSGMYAFGFYKQGSGFAVGIVVARISERTVVWTANRDGGLVSDNASLVFTSAGVALKSTQGQSLVIVENNVSSASMMDSGNFVLYNASGAIVWQSFRYPTDTLLPTQPLLAGTELRSAKSETDHSSGIFRLAMQGDGNLVQYPVDPVDPKDGWSNGYNYAYYATMTNGRGTNVSLNLGVNGDLYLLNDTGGMLMSLFDGGLPTRGWSYLVRIDADGIFRVYSYDLKQKGNWSIEWSSSKDRCVPKGACGVNSYCVTGGATIDCTCLPGFEYVNPGVQTSGCERNSSVVDACKLKNSNCTYTIQELGGTEWENVPYMQLSSSGKEDCKQACLDDLNCQAAFFDDSTCKKQRPPLRYGRLTTTSNILFIKEVVLSSVPPAPDAVVPKGSRKDGKKLFVIIGVSFTALGSILLVISVILFWKHNVWAYKRMNELSGDAEWNEDGAPRPYAYEELEKMTNNFSEEVGRGASGMVYKGVIANSQKLVAVKRLEKVATGEGDKEFQNEMRVIGRTHHRNLVHLHGYCLDGPTKLLVYEYMSNGSLADILFTSEGKPNWEERMGIARNIARGFVYLHEECDKQIIHCDIKPQNILMDEYMCPKIADFGLAKLLQRDQTRTTTGIRGTKGYVAPEWHRKMPITVKADVYSFGIVLLEIVCCRRNVDSSLPHDEAILDDLVYHYFESGQLEKLVGDEEINIRQLERVVRVAIWCIQDEPSLRPSMKKVLLMLEGTVDIPVPPSPVSFLSTI